MTSLSEYVYRMYCPSLGRWLNRDPIYDSGFSKLVEQDDSSSVLISRLRTVDNLEYVFVRNDPTVRIEILGLGYKEDNNVCQYAKDHGWNRNSDGGFDEGGFVCRNGESYMCVWLGPDIPPSAATGVESCIKQHERSHWENGDLKKCKECENGRNDWPDNYGKAGRDRGECKAYAASLRCFYDGVKTCAESKNAEEKKSCEQAFCSFYAKSVDKIRNLCPSTFLPGSTGWKEEEGPCGLIMIPTYLTLKRSL